MATLSDYEKQQLARANQANTTYSQSRNQAATDYYTKLNEAVNTQLQTQTGQLQQQQADLPKQYRDKYDTVEIQKIVNQQNALNNAANTGSLNSGMYNSRQTAINTAAYNQARDLDLQQQAASDELAKQIRQLTANANLQTQQNEAQARQQAAIDILNNYTTLQNSALTNAANLYNTDVSASTAAANRDAQLKAQQAQYEQTAAQQEAQRKQDSFIALISRGATYEEAFNQVYRADLEKASAAEAQKKIEEQYGTGNGALLRAFRAMGG